MVTNEEGAAAGGEGPDADKARERSWIVLVVAFVVALVFQLYYYDRSLQDDAYISFVYARNLLRGEGLVYNVGEAPVEGYTNFLWTVIVSGGMGLGLDPGHLVRALGMACALGLLLTTFAIARRLGTSPVLAACAALLLASRRVLAFEAVGGLETLLFALLVAVALLLRLRPERKLGLDALSGLLLGLAALTRPEGVFVFGLLELWALGVLAVDRRFLHWLGGAVVRALPFVLIVAAHLTFRYETYGDLVPNTFHAKVGGGGAQWERGLEYVYLGIFFFGPFLFFLPYTVLFLRGERRGWAPCLFVSTAYVVYVFAVGGDFKPTARFLIPVIPLWCVLAVAAVDFLGAKMERAGIERARLWAGCLFAVLAVQSGVQEMLYNLAWTDRDIRLRQLEAIGRHLDESLPPGATIAVSNAGAIPYFADRRTIDMLGLNDAHIARMEVKEATQAMVGHVKGDGAYVLGERPDVIFFFRLDSSPVPMEQMPNLYEALPQMAFGTSEAEIAADPKFRRNYRLVSHRLPEDLGFTNYFVRRGRETERDG